MNHRSRKSWQKGEAKVIDCENCGFKHLDPIPKEDKLREYYEDSYSDPLEKINIGDKFQTISRQVASDSPSILDIGAGNGKILKYFKKRGWEVSGIEPHPGINQDEANELGIHREFFSDVNFSELGKFDAIVMSFVLEHVREPIKLLKQAHSALKEGGVICIEVPNDFNPLQETIHEELGVERWWIVSPDHINYFDSDSLESLTKRVGFDIIYAEGSFPVELFILMGENYIRNPELGSEIHEKRLAFEQKLKSSGKNELRRALYSKMIDLGVGRSVILYARKK